jgi:hypothetical protein
MIPKVLETMHQDHVAWRSENGLWRDEVRNWQYELYNVKSDLPRLQADIDAHERALADQATAIRLYDEKLSKQEHVVATCQAGAPCEDQSPLPYRHAGEEVLHQQQSDRHERIKQHHYRVMKHWRALMKAFAEAM